VTTKRLDPRLYQIAVLSGLLLFGLTVLDFDLTITQIVVTLGTAVVTQLTCARLVALRGDTGLRSALISGLSLCLLLRTDVLLVAAAAAGIAVGSKFVLRVGGKHLFNPTNGAIVALLTLATAYRHSNCRSGYRPASGATPRSSCCSWGASAPSWSRAPRVPT
jgi:Na+-transporting NADH:ubiquinone oxidoreductase subunit NqrB